MPFRVVQEPKYAEVLVGTLYIKLSAIIANTGYELTLGTSDQKRIAAGSCPHYPAVTRSGR